MFLWSLTLCLSQATTAPPPSRCLLLACLMLPARTSQQVCSMFLQPLPSMPLLNYSFYKGGEFLGIARKRVLQLSCEQTDGLGAFTVLDSSPFVSFADLRAAPSLFTITQYQELDRHCDDRSHRSGRGDITGKWHH